MAKHTPGPWPKPEPTGDGKRLLIEKNGPGNDSWHRLGVEVDSDDCDSATALANARLIAAAPDLLAACKDVREWLLETRQIPDDGLTHPNFIKANNAVNAAISKAEGRR